jgi:hypothetical protein
VPGRRCCETSPVYLTVETPVMHRTALERKAAWSHRNMKRRWSREKKHHLLVRKSIWQHCSRNDLFPNQ